MNEKEYYRRVAEQRAKMYSWPANSIKEHLSIEDQDKLFDIINNAACDVIDGQD